MNKAFILFSFVLLSTFGIAQQNPKYKFTLEQAIDFALDSNYTAINARRDIAIAIKKKWETTAGGLPQLDANISYQNNLKQPTTLLPGEIAGGDPGSFVPVIFGTKQNATIGATLTQLIFDGSYLVGLQAAKTFLDYSENAEEKTQLEVRKGVINAYGSVLLSKELIKIFELNKINLEKNLLETKAFYENGFTEEESVEQLEITLINLETQLKNSKRTLIIAQQMFNLALGIDVESKVDMLDNLDSLTQENISLEFLKENINIKDNIDYKIASNFTKQRILELKLEKSYSIPNIAAFVNYGTQANNDAFNFFSNDQKWYQSSLLGVSLNIPILSSGLRSARTQQARIALEKAETNLTEAYQRILLEINTAKNNYRFAIEIYNNNKKNLDLSERVEKKNEIKFSEGLSTSFDLRTAQIQLYTAQQNYFEAMLRVITTKADLETLLNTPQLKETN
ncbi:MAG: TolC family protein [Flavobacteriaceae bacterium]|jgi:outer membrane protein|nr:TolC family protein [Flavobacteriaceae bacterium]